jgi:hypothetical protein
MENLGIQALGDHRSVVRWRRGPRARLTGLPTNARWSDARGVILRLSAMRHWRSMSEMVRPWISVIETGAYLARAGKVLSEVEQHAVLQMIARDLTCGVVMEGTGGVRKIRLAIGGRGKSGGARAIYYFHSDVMPVYLLTVFAKNEKANLTPAERNALARMVDTLKRTHGR